MAAIAFQFFGGFYSNAEHVDIIRAFAFAPWLLYVFSLDHKDIATLPRRATFIPPVLYLFLTGAYPGNVLAGGVIIALFVALQFLDAAGRGAPPSALVALSARVAGLTFLGCGMAILQLGPVWLFRDQFVRAEVLATVPRESLGLEHLPGLFVSNKLLPGEISMTSTYLPLPILLLASFTPGAALKRYWVYVSLAVIAALMAAGDRAFLAPMLRSVIPSLGLSRFPSSDYRVFVAIPLILFSLLGLRAIVERQLSKRAIAVKSALCVVWLFGGLTSVYGSLGREAGAAIAVAIASWLTIVALWRRHSVLTLAGVTAIAVLVSVDAVRVLPNLAGWHEADIDEYYLKNGWPPYTRNRGRRLVASSIFRSLPPTRPPRTTPPGLVRWSGYIDGSYLTTDLTPNVLRAAHVVGSNAQYQIYMRSAWSPLLLSPEAGKTGTAHTVLTDAQIAAGLAATNSTVGAVRQTHYGINDITYQVSLKEARLLVENEMYFPGWRARLTTGDEQVIDAVAVNGVFRSWLLPAGEYTMTARFDFPHLLTLRLVCASSTLVWLLVWFVWSRHARTF